MPACLRILAIPAHAKDHGPLLFRAQFHIDVVFLNASACNAGLQLMAKVQQAKEAAFHIPLQSPDLGYSLFVANDQKQLGNTPTFTFAGRLCKQPKPRGDINPQAARPQKSGGG